jgi:hypothetical protein
MADDMRERLLSEFDGLMDAIESTNETWRLADWLVLNIPNPGHGGDRSKPSRDGLTLADLAERRGVGVQWLQRLRATAERFSLDVRVIGSSVRAHDQAYRQTKDVEAARELLLKGGKLRDVTPVMESVEAINENLTRRSSGQQAEVAKKLMSNPDVASAVMQDWDVAKVIDQADRKLTSKTMEKAAELNRTETPNIATLQDYTRAMILLYQARYRIAEALKRITAAPNLNEVHRDALLKRTEAITVAVGWVESFLNSGSKSFDDELAAILAGGENPDN